MQNNLQENILKNIVVNKKIGTVISSKNYELLNVWKDELKPTLKKLEQKGYIQALQKSIEKQFKIIKPITTKTLKNAC